MAEKTLVYEVKIRNGHGTNTEYHVGKTKYSIKKNRETNETKVESVRSIGQQFVDVDFDENSDLAFNINLGKSETLTWHRNSSGYDFLTEKFEKQVDKLESDYRDSFGYDDE
ncbi:hypothetical protein AB6C62_25295, partial [Vibrio splendidus]|uniref:hypothetical protein n=1 Tax=Vibrio splendidus TaxID=29497 RepID=UPI000C84E23E|nr:hypothetical protein [Vibrio splendidus]PMO14914.1 hypothetical protein BCT15_25335 [Vibrio splendidus]